MWCDIACDHGDYGFVFLKSQTRSATGSTATLPLTDFHDGTTAYSKTVCSRTEKNILGYEIIALADFSCGYKRYHTYGQIEDAPRSGRPTLLSQDSLETIEQAVENNPPSFLNDLTKYSM
ncbi:hypothetical protein L873DRAFT_1790685 [Choiromyces venosus 120613-1]|uniref:Uncharacterized protein n=1 Tax=Choiromyces venosus 120613-1 TaxID=1336337 RepID=A0A3N4JVK3_9PEZI|nr:hypothetical protein L873DRAFT_1790685 [Choiromyces venosus 120613-1]